MKFFSITILFMAEEKPLRSVRSFPSAFSDCDMQAYMTTINGWQMQPKTLPGLAEYLGDHVTLWFE